MFTGIVEDIGTIVSIEKENSNKHFTIESKLSNQLKIDQSIAHNGCCLTVVEIDNQNYTVTAIDETLSVTNLNQIKQGDSVNLERCLRSGDRVDGHFVQGHVDTVAEVTDVVDENGSWRYYFSLKSETEHILIPKGSVCINGVSLTLVDSETNHFSVAIIPYTYENTNFKSLKKGDLVNIEFDMLGKYVEQMLKKGVYSK